METQEDITRLTIVGILFALTFGILQYVPLDKKFSDFTSEAILKVSATVFMQTCFIFFLCYLLTLAVIKSHLLNDFGKKYFKELNMIIYDFSIGLTIAVFFELLALLFYMRDLFYFFNSLTFIQSYLIASLLMPSIILIFTLLKIVKRLHRQ